MSASEKVLVGVVVAVGLAVLTLVAVPGAAYAEPDSEAGELAELYEEARREATEVNRLSNQRVWVKTVPLHDGASQAARTMAKDHRLARQILTIEEWDAIKPGEPVRDEIPDTIVGKVPRERSVSRGDIKRFGGEAAAVRQRIKNFKDRQAVLQRHINDLLELARESRRTLAEQSPYVDAAVGKLQLTLLLRNQELAQVKVTGTRIRPPSSRRFFGRVQGIEHTPLEALLLRIARVERDIKNYGVTPKPLDIRLDTSAYAEPEEGDEAPADAPAPVAGDAPAAADAVPGAEPPSATATATAPTSRTVDESTFEAMERGLGKAARRDSKRTRGMDDRDPARMSSRRFSKRPPGSRFRPETIDLSQGLNGEAAADVEIAAPAPVPARVRPTPTPSVPDTRSSLIETTPASSPAPVVPESAALSHSLNPGAQTAPTVNDNAVFPQRRVRDVLVERSKEQNRLRRQKNKAHRKAVKNNRARLRR